jgi:hypothetical protein
VSQPANASPLKQTGNRINLIGMIVGAFLLLIPFPYAAIIGALIIFVCGALLIWHLKWVEEYRPRGGFLIILLALCCAALGYLARPAPMPSASELAKEIAKELPPKPEATPSFVLDVGQAYVQHNIRLQLTEILMQVQIKNLGAPSAVSRWRIYYSSPTLEKELNPVKPLASPMLFRMYGDEDVALEFDYPRDSINEKVDASPITREMPVRGRLLLNVPGDRREEMLRQAQISVSIFDYLGQSSTAVFRMKPSISGQLMPGEKFRRLTEKEKKRFHD